MMHGQKTVKLRVRLRSCLAEFFLEYVMLSDKIVEKIKTYILS
jgi:hypothetical protein